MAEDIKATATIIPFPNQTRESESIEKIQDALLELEDSELDEVYFWLKNMGIEAE
ncbi:MAG: hypothetical protein ACR65R_11520 [Methylomicrobium sp.]